MALSVGDLLFVGWDSDNDDISFIATTDIAAGEVIYFTDNEWTGTDFNNFNEGLIEWTVPVGGVSAGTVIDLEFSPTGGGGTATVSAGTLAVVDGVPNIAGSNEMFWAFQGTPEVSGGFTDTNFIAVIANEVTGNAGNSPNLTGTGLTTSNGAVIIDGDNDYMEWTGDGALSDPVIRQDLIDSILNTGNWTTADSGGNSNPNGTGFDIDTQTVVCFARGTHIQTAQSGKMNVEDLCTGMPICTYGHNKERIRWIGRRKFNQTELTMNPKLRPIRIVAGALGSGLPKRDLLVSRQHRMLVSSKIAARIFGTKEVLIPAIKLIELPGIYIDDRVDEVEYFHVLFDKHEVIFAEGAPTESLYTGPGALNAISSEAKDEILEIFPELTNKYHVPEHAALVPSNKAQKELVARHLKNEKPVLDCFV